MFCSRTSSRVSRRIDFASSHAERLSLRRARFPDRRAPWYCLRVRCTRPVRCKRVRGSWTDHHSSWAVTAQPRHAVQLQIVDKLSTIGGPVSWLDKLAPTRYIRRADSLMFVGSFRPAGVLTEKELCLGRPLLLTFITVITVESNRLQGAGSLRFIRYLRPRRPWVSVPVLPSNFPLGEPVKRMGRTINEGALPEGQVVPSIGAAGHSMLEEAPLEATTNPGPDGVW